MALRSDELSLDLVRRLETEADELLIELNGTVSIVQSKNGVELLKDELDAELVVEILKRFLEDAVKAAVDDD